MWNIQDLKAVKCDGKIVGVEHATSSVHWYTAGPGDMMADLQLLQGLWVLRIRRHWVSPCVMTMFFLWIISSHLNCRSSGTAWDCWRSAEVEEHSTEMFWEAGVCKWWSGLSFLWATLGKQNVWHRSPKVHYTYPDCGHTHTPKPLTSRTKCGSILVK